MAECEVRLVEEQYKWAEIVAAYGQLIIVRHDGDRLVILPGYGDYDDTIDEEDCAA